MDRRELAGAVKTGELIGIPPVRLHAVGSFFGNERRTNQITMNAFAAQMAAENEAARPGFINQAQFNVWLSQPFEELIHSVESSADNAVAAHFGGVLWRDSHCDRIFVDVQADIM